MNRLGATFVQIVGFGMDVARGAPFDVPTQALLNLARQTAIRGCGGLPPHFFNISRAATLFHMCDNMAQGGATPPLAQTSAMATWP